MATGGTIPTNRTQTVTFFNTTGIVDIDKNIFFAPRFSKYAQLSSSRDVRSAYLEIFKTVCPPSSAYADIQISGWSPQDKTLKVRGNIDDFRIVTEEGESLNYFILSRTITKENVDRTYYYGFFITGVQQAGGGSVLLTVEPDDFTNVFYLHNKHVLSTSDISGDYEPYNEKIKNAYVNRQHYNRVGYFTRTRYEEHNGSKRFTLSPNEVMNIDIPIQHLTLDLVDENHFVSYEFGSVTVSEPEIISLQLTEFVVRYTITNGSELSAGDFYYSFKVPYSSTELEPDNMKVFLNQEETYRYKYQYRDMKYPISIYDGNFTKEEIESIDSEDTFNNLPASLRRKIIKTCISYLVVETKSPEIVLPYYYVDRTNNYTWIRRDESGQLITGQHTRRSNPVLCLPFMQVPEVFEKYNLESMNIRFVVDGIPVVQITTAGRNKVEQLLHIINSNSIADYIYSVYYAKEVNMPNSVISVDLTNNRIDFNVTIPDFVKPTETSSVVYPTHLNTGVYLSGILRSPISQDSDINYDNTVCSEWQNNHLITIYNRYGALALMVSGYHKNEFTINVTENMKDLTSNYWDNVLEAEPYSFYAISYLSGYEMVFNKNRYYEGKDSSIKVIHYISINGAVKEGFIPRYTVGGFESKYFNEGMSFINSSNLALYSDSYASFYYQNQAQMKNQFAVANYQYNTDFWQKFFVTSPNQVGLSASRRGGWGALAETGNQIMGWVDDAIDHAQNKHIIEMNQKAKLADMGAKPDTLKQTGSDLIYDLSTNEYQPFLNHYTIDELSYNSIAKLLERTGYQVNLYSTLNTMNRVGWNFVKLNSFDVVSKITVNQETTIRKILTEGVTLLHDKSYLTSGHNYETILEGGE